MSAAKSGAGVAEAFLATLDVDAETLRQPVHETIRPQAPLAVTGERDLLGTLPTLDAARELSFERVLGEGGMGLVREAVQLPLGRRVAVKSVKAVADPQKSVELLREARGTGGLEHPNVVPVYMLGRGAGGEPLLVMKRIEGTRWSDLLRADGPSPSGEPMRRHLRTLVQVCHALAFAHSRGIVHRDVKPDNVMIGAFGEVYLLDWGIAVHVGAGFSAGFPHAEELHGLAGTPSYMAPEQVRPRPDRITARTDVFLAGAVLHHVVTGSAPYRAENLNAALYLASQAAEQQYGPEVDAELSAILRRAMHADPMQRYADAKALGAALEAYLEHETSIGIAREAADTLARAQDALPADERHRLFSRARVAFEIALRSWAENPEARRGLETCLARQAAQYLDEKNLGEARRLVAELREADASLEARVRALEAEEAANAERVARLEQMARDLDLSSTRWSRTVMLLGLAVFWAAFPAAIQWFVDTGRLVVTTERLLFPGIPVYAASLGLVILVTRQELFATKVGRRLVAALGVSLSVTLVTRLIAWTESLPAERAVPFELAGYGFLFVMLGATVQRTFTRGGAIYALGALAAARWPERAYAWTAASNFLALVAVLPSFTDRRGKRGKAG